MYLSRKQLKLLKTISKSAVIRTDKNDIKDIEYLRLEKLVEVSMVDKKDDFFYQAYITEHGKAYLDNVTQHNIEHWVPVVISNLIALAALILSIIALLQTAAMPT